jgi:hypothetical protein
MNKLSALILNTGLLFAPFAFGDSVEIPVHASFKPTKATGIIFSSRGAVERIPATIKSNETMFLVSFDVSNEEKKSGLSASALVTGEEGESAYGDVVQLNQETPLSSALTLEECNPEKDPLIAAEVAQASDEDIGSLIAIRDYRIKKASNERSQIRKSLPGTLSVRLTKLEKGLGLSLPDDKPLSSELPAAELANRLSALEIALDSYLKVQSSIKAQR